MPIRISAHPVGAVISVKVVPGASRDRIVGALGEALKITVAQPPAAGAANRAVEKLLAEALGVARGRVSIVRGEGRPQKDVLVAGMDVAELSEKIKKLI